MKKNFWIACGLVIILSASLIGYGIYVNYAGESTIIDRMAKRSVPINASVAALRTIKPQYLIKEANLEARHSFDVIAKTDGVIQHSFLSKNKAVKAGEVLMELLNEDIPLKIISAGSALKRAQAGATQAQNSFNRYSRLMEMDATSREKMDEARANYEASLASVEDAQAQLDQAKLMQERLRVTSPADGNVVMIYKQQGNYVTAGTPLCLVADYSSMWFAVNMQDNDVQALLGKGGMSSSFTLTSPSLGQDKAYSTEYRAGNKGNASSFPVVIRGIFPSLEQPASLRRVVFHVDNSGAVLEPHAYTYLQLTSDLAAERLTVSSKALFDEDADNRHMLLYVVTEDNTLEKRTVEVGARNDEYTEILSGLTAGERVVTSSREGLADGQRVEINYLEEK